MAEEELKAGDKVRLTEHFLGTFKTKKERRAFDRVLTIMAIEKEMIRLSNGTNFGLCRLRCTTKDVRKIS